MLSLGMLREFVEFELLLLCRIRFVNGAPFTYVELLVFISGCIEYYRIWTNCLFLLECAIWTFITFLVFKEDVGF